MLVVLIPFVYMFSSSIKPQSYIFEIPPRLFPSEVTSRNYTEALSTDQFGVYFINSLIVAVTSTAFTVLIASMLAYAFGRMQFRGKGMLFTLLLLGMMIPPVMLIIPQFLIAKELHLLNSLPGLIVVTAYAHRPHAGCLRLWQWRLNPLAPRPYGWGSRP
jgi:multiple sugar transport system permease protein